VLRHGLKHGPYHLDLFYGTPSPGNMKAAERYAANRFSVTRQLRYSRDETQRALDLGLFIQWPARRHLRAEGSGGTGEDPGQPRIHPDRADVQIPELCDRAPADGSNALLKVTVIGVKVFGRCYPRVTPW
jgi:hypothetical protein